MLNFRISLPSMRINAPEPLSRTSIIRGLEISLPEVGIGLSNFKYCSPCSVCKNSKLDIF